MSKECAGGRDPKLKPQRDMWIMSSRLLTLLVVIALVSAAAGYGMASIAEPTKVETPTEIVPRKYITIKE
jgi:hypothetical protein